MPRSPRRRLDELGFSTSIAHAAAGNRADPTRRAASCRMVVGGQGGATRDLEHASRGSVAVEDRSARAVWKGLSQAWKEALYRRQEGSAARRRRAFRRATKRRFTTVGDSILKPLSPEGCIRARHPRPAKTPHGQPEEQASRRGRAMAWRHAAERKACRLDAPPRSTGCRRDQRRRTSALAPLQIAALCAESACLGRRPAQR